MHTLSGSIEKGLLQAYAWFPPDLPHLPFSFADFALSPFTVINQINCTQQYSYMLSAVSSPIKSSHLEVAFVIRHN